ncbi:MHYT domain-containing protein, partial [Mesorhizobium japonicum]|uniref:MHYT domain-containing protein n=1 Tax=Mesorhizobium japonicum TaxID=2066070 RepID=UPI003B5C66B1
MTFVSFLLAVAGTGVAFLTASRPGSKRYVLPAGGLLMGLSIVAMHYVGMAAVRTTATLGYRPALVVLSVLIAVVAST